MSAFGMVVTRGEGVRLAKGLVLKQPSRYQAVAYKVTPGRLRKAALTTIPAARTAGKQVFGGYSSLVFLVRGNA